MPTMAPGPQGKILLDSNFLETAVSSASIFYLLYNICSLFLLFSILFCMFEIFSNLKK